MEGASQVLSDQNGIVGYVLQVSTYPFNLGEQTKVVLVACKSWKGHLSIRVYLGGTGGCSSCLGAKVGLRPG